MPLPTATLAVPLSSAVVFHAGAFPADSDPDSDRALLLLVEQRDELAMARIFERHSRLVYSVAVRVLHDPAQAEDVLQETFMQVWKKPITLDEGRGSLRALLAVMARNRSVDLLRQRKQTQSTDDFDFPSSFDLEVDSERRLLLHRVLEVARNLPPEQQSVLELTYLEGLTNAEIASKTGTPLGTVKARIRSAVISLEKTLSQTCVGAPERKRPGAQSIRASRAKLQSSRTNDMTFAMVELAA